MQMEEIGREEGLWNPQIRQTHDWWIQLLSHPGVYSYALPFLLSFLGLFCRGSDVGLTEMEIISHLYLEVSWQWQWLLLGEAGSSSQGEESLEQLRAPGSSSTQAEHTFPAGTHTHKGHPPTHPMFTHLHRSWALTLQTHREHTWTQLSPMLALGDASPWDHSPSSVVITDQLAHTENSLGHPCLSSLLWSWPQRFADPLAPRPCHLLPAWSSSSFTGDHRLWPLHHWHGDPMARGPVPVAALGSVPIYKQRVSHTEKGG